MWAIFLISFYTIGIISARVTDAEYALMPPVFQYDDFDRCMLIGPDAVYISAIIELSPADATNSSKIWKIIEEESRPAKNFNHHKLRHGICIWQTCSRFAQNADVNNADDLRNVVNDCYNDKFTDIEIKTKVTEMHVERGAHTIVLDNYNIFLILCLVGLGTLLAWGTIYEGRARYETKEVYYEKTKLSGFGKTISCFSLPKNWEQLFSPFQSEDAAALKGIQGMRFFAMFSIISSHTNIFLVYPGVYNTRAVENMFGKPESVIMLNNTYACQVFFVVSAWLLSYHFCLIFENNKKPNLKFLILSFINRYLRLTPCLVALVILFSCTSNLIETGPVSYKPMEHVDSCKKNWWANLLYINNYYDTPHMCVPHSWYLATDVQLYALSLIIIGIIWKFRRFTRVIFGVSLAVAVLIPIIQNYVSDYDICPRAYPEWVAGNLLIESEILRKMYMPAHNNMGSYIIGLIFGYLFHATRNKNVFTKNIYVYLWYFLVIVPPLVVVLLGIPFYSDDYVNNRILAALYVGIGRNVVSFSIALCLFGITHGVGWLIRDILFWEPFQILGKLCYCAYLFHFAAMLVRAAEQRFPSYFQMRSLAWQTFGDLIVSFVIALIICLSVELPLQALQKLYIPQINDKKKQEAKLEQTRKNIRK